MATDAEIRAMRERGLSWMMIERHTGVGKAVAAKICEGIPRPGRVSVPPDLSSVDVLVNGGRFSAMDGMTPIENAEDAYGWPAGKLLSALRSGETGIGEDEIALADPGLERMRLDYFAPKPDWFEREG